MELKFDAEFHTLIPPLTSEERTELEASILREGCRDALVVWDGTIIDGHNRYEICQKHGLPFKVHEIAFAGRDEAKVWIIRNQFGRRNLPQYVRCELVLKLDTLVKEIQTRAAANKSRAGQQSKSFPQDRLSRASVVEKINTTEELSKIAGVAPATLKRAKAIYVEGTEEQKERVRSGKAGISTVYHEIRHPKKPQESKTEPQEPTPCTPKPLFISVRHIQILVQHFLAEASGYIRMPDQIALLTAEERKQILKEVEPIENWCKEFQRILSC